MSAQPALFEIEPSLRVPTRVGASRVTARRVKQILTKATGMVSGFDFTLNPYIGCSFGCAYCYAAFFQPDEAKAADWGNWVEVKENAVALVSQERRLAGAHVYVGSVTDPYQPLEKQTRLMRSLLEVMSELGPQPRLVVQTRSPIATRDIDLFQRFTHFKLNMSVTTDSDDVRKRYEPGCASIERRLAAVQRLSEAGIDVCLSLSPLLPVKDVESFAECIRASGARSAWVGYFHPGTRRFASGTRPNALTLAREDGWGFESYLDTVSQLRKLLPGMLTKSND